MLLSFLILFLQSRANIARPLYERDVPPAGASATGTYKLGRPVSEIVWSCIATTFLCAWVSIHPDTLHNLGGSWERAGQKVRFLLVTVLAPELVVGWASKDLLAAWIIKQKFQSEGFKISMTHAHLIEMGGFALCFPEEKARQLQLEPHIAQETSALTANLTEVRVIDNELVKLRYIETLSGKRFKELLFKSSVQFPRIAQCELDDRSKADFLAKFITVFQALWFVTQCIVRKKEGLAITELELTTLALASLNVYMLLLWSYKPKDIGVQVPVYLLEDSEEWEKACEKKLGELDAERKSKKEEEDKREGKRETLTDLCLRFMSAKVKSAVKNFWAGFLGRSRESSQMPTKTASHEELQDVIPRVWKKALRRVLPLSDLVDRKWWSSIDFMSLAGWYKCLMGFVWAPFDLLVWGIIVAVNLVLCPLLLLATPVLFLVTKSPQLRNLIDIYLLNQRADNKKQSVRDQTNYAIQAAIVGTVFGGLHCIGWHFPFPTPVERWLWRTMALALTIIPNFSAIWASGLLSRTRKMAKNQVPAGDQVNRIFTVESAYFIGSLVIYILARLIILVLALKLLRDQPASAYVEVSWTQVFPHISI